MKADIINKHCLLVQVERLDAELKQSTEETRNLKDVTTEQAAKLEDASMMLQVWFKHFASALSD